MSRPSGWAGLSRSHTKRKRVPDGTRFAFLGWLRRIVYYFSVGWDRGSAQRGRGMRLEQATGSPSGRVLAVIFIATMAVWGASTTATAQIDLNQFRPSERTKDGFAISTADDMGHAKFGVQVYIDYGDDPLVFADGSGGEADVVAKQLTGHLQLSVGLWDRLIIYLGAPYHIILEEDSSDDFSSVPAPLPAGSGFGDTWFGARVLLYGQTQDVFQVSLQGTLNFQTAEIADGTQRYRGGPSIGGHPELLFTFNFIESRLRLSGNLGYWIREDQKLSPAVNIGDELTYGIGLIFSALNKRHKVDLLVEWFGRTGTGQSGFGDAPESPMEVLAGAKYHHPNGFTTGFGAGGGVQKGYGAPDWRILGLLGFAMPEEGAAPDADKDGVPDETDQCPKEPEDIDGFQDEDGCPDPDNDGDGILDIDDGAPNDAEDLDGFQDEDGIPDPDNDRDGVPDIEDRCPLEIGPPEAKGCPDPDRDGDGVPDRIDNCPDQRGTVENKGCKAKQLVEIKDDKLEILDKVYFRTASHSILRRSNALLNNVAEVIKAHPEIKQIQVEGHTDARGSVKYNMRLSQRRANSVVRYLQRRGVPKSRLIAKGLGPTRPVYPDATTDEEHAANRRVEFNIVE